MESLKALVGLIVLSACGHAVKAPENTNIGGNTPTEHVGALKVLMLGDSVAMGYIPVVREMLTGLAEVFDSKDNCRNSYYTNENVDTWLAANPNMDVITFNFGLWNTINSNYTNRYPDVPLANYGTTDAEYEADLISTARKLKASGARIIFFLTTDAIPNTDEDVERIVDFNNIALRVLPLEGVEVYDLHKVSLTLKDRHLGQNHFDDTANKIIGGFVSNAILGGI